MNRLAVVLAADSASTVTYWGDHGKEERYFKGANKIFQLSNHHPIGLMIYDSAAILSVPWEVVIKEFRKQLETKSFNAVEDYADEFFAFLSTDRRLFPAAVQKENFINAARAAAAATAFELATPDKTSSEVLSRLDRLVKERIAKLEAEAFKPPLDEEKAKDVFDLHMDELVASLEEWREIPDVLLPDSNEVAKLGILEILKDPSRLATTGMVFAGFGDHDIFPSMAEYTSFGVVGGRHLSRRGDVVRIDHEFPASLKPFAQSSMTDTFTLGLSFDAYMQLGHAVSDALADFAKKICLQVGADLSKLSDFEAQVAQAAGKVSEGILEQSKRDHALPMRRVLGVLPVDEMAELAETLINLQSLKEKVTKPSASVGGPVDVAVITKSEGLIWIRRKHFFDPSINSRYMQRQAASLK